MDDDVRDRALGSVLAAACGDALGAGYEAGPPLDLATPVLMRGGGVTQAAPGEWTDDTAMAIPLLEAIARGDRLDEPRTLGRVVAEWADWAQDAPDAGAQTRAVFAGLDAHTEAAARAAATAVHEATGRSAGNGSLMRTGPVALAHLGDGTKKALAATARRVSELTHHEDDAGDACVLWTAAIRRAVRKGDVDVRTGIPLLPRTRRARWLALLDEAEQSNPADFADDNGWVVAALQGAVSAVTRGTDLVDVLERAVRGGNDTDTVAAIAGALAGARYGAAALPDGWLAVVHGWPGKRLDWLRGLTLRALDHTR